MSIARFALLAVAPLFASGCARANADSLPVRDVAVHVTSTYDPSTIAATAGEHVRLHFTRDAEGCTSEVVFPSLGLKRDLPLHRTVVVDLGTVATGEIPFHCGMDMVRGKVTVKPRG